MSCERKPLINTVSGHRLSSTSHKPRLLYAVSQTVLRKTFAWHWEKTFWNDCVLFQPEL
jgi:hypothetical protein